MTVYFTQDRLVDFLFNKIRLRDWWFSVVSECGRFPSYAFFLLLPSDEEMFNYLASCFDEINVLSGDNCLIIMINGSHALSGNHHWHLWDNKPTFSRNIVVKLWRKLLSNYSKDGYSLLLAKHFGIKFSQLPCLVLFNDIRSSEHVLVNLKEFKYTEISHIFREIFSVINEAVEAKQNPIEMLIKYQEQQDKTKIRRNIISNLRVFASKTMETAMEVLLKKTL